MIITGDEKPYVNSWVLRYSSKNGFVVINRRLERKSEVVFNDEIEAQASADELNEIN